MISGKVFEIYKQYFRDVGENTFVFNENTLKRVVTELSKLSMQKSFTANKEQGNDPNKQVQ